MGPVWVWVMRVTPGAADSDLPRVQLVARMAMVMTDGNAMYAHTITNFTLASHTSEGNTTDVFEGTATVYMRDRGRFLTFR